MGRGSCVAMRFPYRAISCLLLVAYFHATIAAFATAQKPQDPVEALMVRMSPADKVGQLFIVTFAGDDVGSSSAVARLIREYRVGGFILSPSNGNFTNDGNTPVRVAELTEALQRLAMSLTITTTKTITTNATPTVDVITHTVSQASPIPLLIGLEQEGDGYPHTALINGFTSLPSSMALGAGWNPGYAEAVGAIVGQELSAVGINLLLGPSLDVLDMPRPGLRGDLGARAFGGDPFWTGRLGQAYVRGVHLGSRGKVATVVKHFPGQGSSDRRPDEEIATVQKSLEILKQIELPPFAAVAQGAPGGSERDGVTDAMMSSHIRYRGFQGNIRQLTPPISLAPQLQDVLDLQQFVPWREGGGIMLSDALGAPGVKRVYDPEMRRFPARQIAQDAFLAGNDLLYLSQYAISDRWEDQLANIEATLKFFQEKYLTDKAFEVQVDAAVRRILGLKVRLYTEFTVESVAARPPAPAEVVGQSGGIITQIAREAITLIYPGETELADRIPTAPLGDENILIVTDARQARECPECPPFTYIEPRAIEEIILRLYGPQASGQVRPEQLQSLSFAELKAYLLDESPEEGAARISEVEQAIEDAYWIVFAMLDVETETHPNSDAIKQFLRMRSDALRDKKLIVFALNAPYYLDTTEISKLTAYFGVYAKSPPFLEAAVRALYREFNPRGALPVSVPGINYEVFVATAPDPTQIVALGLKQATLPEGPVTPIDVKQGDSLQLIAGPVLDHNGHIVPDGTVVVFRFFYPGESLELPRQEVSTKDGYAEATVTLNRKGELRVTAVSGSATQSTMLVVSIQEESVTIETVVPTRTPTPVPIATATSAFLQTVVPTPAVGATSPPRRVDERAFITALGVALVVALTALLADVGSASLAERVPLGFLSIIGGLAAYIVYGLGWLPGATNLQWEVGSWGAGIVSLFGALAPLGIFGVIRFLTRLTGRVPRPPVGS